MSDLSSIVSPAIFVGGQATDYGVEVLSNGGLGTRHLLTGRVLPHVLYKPQIGPGDVLGSPQGLGSMAQLQAGAQVFQLGLSAANLGVGLLNLGVSAWTAWKVHKMDKRLDGVAVGVQRVEHQVGQLGGFLALSVRHLEGLIRDNAQVLGLLVDNQANLGRGLAILQQELSRGLLNVQETLVSIEARRESNELEQQMRALFRYYETCTLEMEAGRSPPVADLRRIVDVSSGLVAWLDTRLAALCPGRPERLPLLVARAFAVRLESEARTLLDEGAAGQAREQGRMLAGVGEELRVLTKGASLFELAEQRRVLIDQYVFLHRSLRGSITTLELSDGRVLPLLPQRLTAWDDGLGRVRELVAAQSGMSIPSSVELTTLEEHRAWQRLSGLPRGASADHVGVGEVTRALGVPPDRKVSEEQLRELLRLGPSALADAQTRVGMEVAWS